MKPFFILIALPLVAIPAVSLGSGEVAARRGTQVTQGRSHAAPRTQTYGTIARDAVYAVPKPSGVVYTYGKRRYAGREYLIVPGQWYPPVWEDACGVKRTCAIPGVAPWPGVRVDANSDEIELAPVGPPPIPGNCAPPAPRSYR